MYEFYHSSYLDFISLFDSLFNKAFYTMTLNEYQEKAMMTNAASSDNDTYSLFGLMAEVGELADKVAKVCESRLSRFAKTESTTARRAYKMADIKVKLVKSLIGSNKAQIATANSLGLKKIGDVSVQPNNPQTQGKVKKISHLIETTEA